MARSLFLLSAVAVLSFAACKKVDDTQSPEDSLRGGQWRRSSLKSTFQGTTTDGFALLPDCLKDNTLEFKMNRSGTERRNNRCNAGDPESTDFQWEFYNSGKNLRLYNIAETFGGAVDLGQGLSINAEVLTLSDNQLSLRYVFYKQHPDTQLTDTTTVVDVFRR